MHLLDELTKKNEPVGCFGPLDEVVGSNFGYYGDVKESFKKTNSFMHHNANVKNGYGLFFKKLFHKYNVNYLYAVCATSTDASIVKVTILNTKRGEYIKLEFYVLEEHNFLNKDLDLVAKSLLGYHNKYSANPPIQGIDKKALHCFDNGSSNDVVYESNILKSFLNNIRCNDESACLLLPLLSDDSLLSKENIDIKLYINSLLENIVTDLNEKDIACCCQSLLLLLVLANRDSRFLSMFSRKFSFLYDYFLKYLLEPDCIDSTTKETLIYGLRQLLLFNNDRQNLDDLTTTTIYTTLYLDALLDGDILRRNL